MTRLTFIKGAIPSVGTWAPDGKHIVFPVSTNDLAGPGIYWMRADGAGEPQRLAESFALPASFSRDGKRIVYYVGAGTGTLEHGIWTLPLNLEDPEHPKPGKPELFLNATAAVQNPVVSPDGRWIAYVSSETQPPQLFVRPFLSNSPAGGKWQISNDGASLAFWSPSGTELFYVTRGIGMRVVSYTTTGDSFVASLPRTILEKIFTLPLAGPPELMPDGKRVMIVTAGIEESSRATHVNFLLNFAGELKRRFNK
jgi:Tol biopolymer transport system component